MKIIKNGYNRMKGRKKILSKSPIENSIRISRKGLIAI